MPFFLISVVYSQNKEIKKYYTFQASNVYYFPQRFNNVGLEIITSKIMPTFQVGAGFSRLNKRNWLINSSLSFSKVPNSVHLRFYWDSPYVNNIHQDYFTFIDYNDFKISFYETVGKLFKVHENNYLGFSLMLGLNFNHPMNTSKGISLFPSLGNLKFFEYELERMNPITFSYGVKYGYYKFLKNTFYSVNAVLVHAPTLVGFGYYKFNHFNFESYGLVRRKWSYFGLEFNVGISRKTSKK